MPEHADIKALQMATTHMFSTGVIQNLWTGDVGNSVDNTWKAGDYRWTSRENSGMVHTRRCAVHSGHTGPVHKKWAANWENGSFPRIHSPYYYYVLITQ
jgi:hypothetical protein